MHRPGVPKVAVLGYPVSHSLSPRLHGFWLKAYGMEGEYSAIAVAPQELQHFLQSLKEKGFRGVNLTVPHKEAAMAWVDEIEGNAQKIGAVNTIVVGETLVALNTDSYGCIQNIKEGAGGLPQGKAVVLGAGGAARAVVAGLAQEGIRDITLVNRNRDKANAVAALWGAKVEAWENRHAVLEGAALLVNATTLGMEGNPPLDVSLDALPKQAVVNDIVYTPLMTPLLKNAHARGNLIVDGLGMLLHQAAPAFNAWFGILPHVTPALRAHILEAL